MISIQIINRKCEQYCVWYSYKFMCYDNGNLPKLKQRFLYWICAKIHNWAKVK